MRPSAVVLLVNSKEEIVAHEFFFSTKNAQAAFQSAMKSNRDGRCELEGEVSGWLSTGEVIPRLIPLGEYVSTTEDRFRKSFLNLTEKEEEEIAESLLLNVRIVRELSKIEKDCLENTRRYAQRYTEGTKGRIRKWLPRSVARFLLD